MSRCLKPCRNLWLLREAQAAGGPLLVSLEVFWRDIAVTCVWWCPERWLVVLASRWRGAAIWKFFATHSAKERRRWKGSLPFSETAYGGWASWRPAAQVWRDAKSWQTGWEAIVRFSGVLRRSLWEVEVFQMQGRTRSVPLRLP